MEALSWEEESLSGEADSARDALSSRILGLCRVAKRPEDLLVGFSVLEEWLASHPEDVSARGLGSMLARCWSWLGGDPGLIPLRSSSARAL